MEQPQIPCTALIEEECCNGATSTLYSFPRKAQAAVQGLSSSPDLNQNARKSQAHKPKILAPGNLFLKEAAASERRISSFEAVGEFPFLSTMIKNIKRKGNKFTCGETQTKSDTNSNLEDDFLSRNERSSLTFSSAVCRGGKQSNLLETNYRKHISTELEISFAACNLLYIKETKVEPLELCNKASTSIATLCGSSQSQRTIHSCQVCHKCFTLKGNLKRHIRLHYGIKPYLCFLCGKRFSRSTDLNNHLKIKNLT